MDPLERTRELSDLLVRVARQVRVLDRLAWPAGQVAEFLAAYRRGQLQVPQGEAVAPVEEGVLVTLHDIERRASASEAVEDALLAATARSYADGVRLVAAAGTPAFTELSRAMYGAPDDLVHGAALTHAALAHRVLAMSETASATQAREEERLCLSAEHVRDAMLPRMDAMFGAGGLEVKIDASLGAKAAASMRRVRLRGGACFSEADIDQLLEHEVFVHAATARNGAEQPLLTALSLGAPRTTATQEGLATFAELITGAMDVSRLRRIALRILGVEHALGGADFVEVFRFFLAAGQSEEESAQSAARIFRGAAGGARGHAFTKDTVYLAGLFATHTFFRRALVEGRLELLPRLFAGRLTLADVVRLDEAFAAGRIVPGRALPRWIADPRRLAAYLVFSAATNPIDLDDVDLLALSP